MLEVHDWSRRSEVRRIGFTAAYVLFTGLSVCAAVVLVGLSLHWVRSDSAALVALGAILLGCQSVVWSVRTYEFCVLLRDYWRLWNGEPAVVCTPETLNAFEKEWAGSPNFRLLVTAAVPFSLAFPLSSVLAYLALGALELDASIRGEPLKMVSAEAYQSGRVGPRPSPVPLGFWPAVRIQFFYLFAPITHRA